MQDLISTPSPSASSNDGKEKAGREREMYGFVVDELGRLEERLLECLAEAEEGVEVEEVGGEEVEKRTRGWTIVPKRMRGRTDVALRWLPVRGKALELVRQRDALGSRVLFAQMSVMSGKVREHEVRARKREEGMKEKIRVLEEVVREQGRHLERVEGLVYRVMHRDRLGRERRGSLGFERARSTAIREMEVNRDSDVDLAL